MTRKEAINRLIDAKEGYKEYLTDEAIDIAIEAIEQTISADATQLIRDGIPLPKDNEDAIGREDMLDAIGHGTTYTSEELQRIIKGLPPVNPQPKTGYWILTSDDDYEYCTCSECGYQNGENRMIGRQIKECQERGAKMIEPKEGKVNNG